MIALRNLIRTQFPKTWKLGLQSRLIYNEIDQDFPKINIEEKNSYDNNLNDVKLIGSVVSEPFTSYIPNYDTEMASFYLATKSNSKFSKNHNVHFIVSWGIKKVEYVNKNIKIGSRVYVSGEIRCNGQNRPKIYAFKIFAL